MENNTFTNKFQWLYTAGFLIILALPLLVLPPYFFPPDWGKTIMFRSIMAALLFIFVFQLLFKKNELALPNIKKNIIVWLLVAFMAIYFLATLFSVDPFFSLWSNPSRGGGVITLAFYIIFTLLTFVLFKKEDWSKAWNVSIIIGVLVSLVAVIQYFSLFARIILPVPTRPFSTMGNPTLLATYLLLLSFMTLSFALKEKVMYLKIFYGFSFLLFLYTILITGSRGAYLGLATGFLYFLLWYPVKKIKTVKTAVAVMLIVVAGAIFYINTTTSYPKFVEQNRFLESTADRLSIRLLLNDPRFYAWSGIDYKIIVEKPILGYGPENFSVGFDKYYDPSIPYLNVGEGGWWDRAHNIILQTGSDAGFLGIAAYLALLIILFYKLQKIKSANSGQPNITVHAIQTTLIAYLVTNMFSFDSFSTYLIFFLLIGYSLHTIYQNTPPPKQYEITKNATWKYVITVVSLCLLILFLWQYNLVPFFVNAKINKAQNLVSQKNCTAGLDLMDKTLQEHSFLDSYARIKYVELTKTCNNYYPQNNAIYLKRGIELIGEAVKIQPFYTRFWLLLGNSTTALAGLEKDVTVKNSLINQAGDYFSKALQLAPKHQEIIIGQTKMAIVSKDYKSAQRYAKTCIALNSDLGDCYWYLALADIYLQDKPGTQENLELAFRKKYDVNDKVSLDQLADAYGFVSNYQELINIFSKLATINPSVAQYHSSLAFFYKQLGHYAQARQEAMEVLRLSPESKENVEAFLKTLPK